MPRQSFSARLIRFAVAAPDRLVLILLWTSLVVAATILPGIFTPWLVVPVLIATLAATWRLMPDAVAPSTPSLVGALGVLAIALGWLVVNLPHASRYVTVTRDPGFLTLEGLWLTTHADPDLPIGSAQAVQDSVPGALVSTGAYFPADGMLHAQGAKLLPGLLALAGWVGGDLAVLTGNLAIGALALVALYGLSRRVVGPLWALLPVIALAASVPLGVFSRAAYTEPLTVALFFGGLMMSWSAFTTSTWWRHLLAGAMIGGTALARIDGAAAVIGLIAGVGLAAAATTGRRSRGRSRTALLVTTGAALAMVAIGYLDLRWHSPGYLSDLDSQFRLLAGALVATVAVSLALALPQFWAPGRRWVFRHRRALSTAAVVMVILVGAVLTSRPLWLVEHHTPLNTVYSALVEGLQSREGLDIDPGRSYDEYTVTWLSWYYGWPMVLLAFGGLALIARRSIRFRDPRHLVLLTAIGAPSALYLSRASISADQVWAMRRFLPVTIPGFLLAATVAVVAIWAVGKWWARGIAVLLAITVAAFPFFTWGSLFTVAEQGGRWTEINAVCSAVDGHNVIYVRAGGPPYLETLRTVCDVEVVEFQTPPTTEELRSMRAAWGGDDVAVVAFGADALPWPGGAAPPPFKSSPTTTWSYSLSYVPQDPVVVTSTVWVGIVGADGAIVAKAPAAE